MICNSLLIQFMLYINTVPSFLCRVTTSIKCGCLCQDDFPLASLPLLGYAVDTPSTEDNIQKDFVFKLQFKNHVYFFRAESQFTYDRSVAKSFCVGFCGLCVGYAGFEPGSAYDTLGAVWAEAQVFTPVVVSCMEEYLFIGSLKQLVLTFCMKTWFF